MPRRTPQQRFWSNVRKGDVCWNWTGGVTKAGYGRILVNRVSAYAHRFAYELLVGPIPEGLVIDHLCRNTRCVNPDHLEPVTHAENIRRGYPRKSHCVHGHEWTPENTMHPVRNRPYLRQCRQCNKIRVRRYRQLREEQI